MKKLIVLAMILVLMAMATAVLAVPPEQSPWVPAGLGDCTHPSGAPGQWYLNTYGDNRQCFKAE